MTLKHPPIIAPGRQLLLLLSLFLLTVLPAGAQHRELFLKHFTVDQGLPSNEVYRILEDTSGYLWITTDRGIVRYDGYAFEEMPVAGSAEVYPWFGIQQDISGKIYFVGLKGHVAVYENGHLHAYPYNDKAAKLGVNYLTASQFLVRQDSIWFSYENEGNFVITPGGAVIEEKVAPGIYFDLSRQFFSVKWDKSASLRPSIPIYIIWEHGAVSVDSLPRPADRGSGILHHERVNGQDLFCVGRHVLFYRNGRRQGQFVFPRIVYSFAMLDDRHALVGFSNGGVGLYELREASLEGPLQVWLPGLSVTKILRDFQGGLWFATRENGLFYASPARSAYQQGQGPILFVGKQQQKIFAGYQSGLVQVFRKGEMLYQTQVPVSREERVTVYTFSSSGDIMAFTGKGIYVHRNGWTRHPAKDPEELPGPENKLAAGYPMAYKLRDIYARFDMSARRITAVFTDTGGRIWFGTYEGLYVYEEDTLIRYAARNPCFADRIVAIKELPDHTVAIATLGSGLVLYRDGRMHLLNKKNGLVSSIINDIETDGDTVWMATNKGLSKAVFAAGRFHVWHYGESYGWPTLDIHMLSIVDGWIYFKWIDRLVMVEKSRLHDLSPSGAPHITSVTAGGKYINAGDSGVFRYNQNSLKITYSSISLANGTRQVYRYRLQGFDDKWYVSAERQAVFTNLPPGAYTFSVQVADAQGNFLPLAARYSFEVRPAFWQQWWFPIAIGLLLLLLALFYFRARLRSVKNKNQLLLDLAENQQKALVQLINPHFIFNVLNTAQAAILKEDKMNAASIISRFAKLMRLSLELSREPFVRLDQEVELLKRYIDLEMIRTPGKFTYGIYVGPDIDAASVTVPSMLIQPFAENAIKHGIMHVTDRIAHLELRFEREGGLILCAVDDSGIGRERSASINASRLRKHHSVGIDITCRRLRLLHREKNTEYRYLVRDKYDEKGLPAGTVVIFSIPFNQQS